MTHIKYSICATHLNMKETVEKSLKSILRQIDDRFEVVLVDEDSTDGSLEILREIEKEEEKLRLIVAEKNGRNLGETRNISIKEAKGEYVLPQLDMDDYFLDNYILDFVNIFYQLEEQLDYDFYLRGDHINMAKKTFVLEMGGYRDLPVGAEDLDLWRRLLAEDRMVCLKHKPIHEEIGYEKNLVDKWERVLKVRKGELKSGIEFKSYFSWLFSTSSIDSKFKLPFHILALLIAKIHLLFSREETLATPKEFSKKEALHREIKRKRKTIKELAEEYDFEIDESEISENGKNIFYL